MAKRDYYEVLGIDKGADDAAIKKAYRQMRNMVTAARFASP